MYSICYPIEQKKHIVRVTSLVDKLFAGWHKKPVIDVIDYDDEECALTVHHDDVMFNHEAVDIIRAAIDGYLLSQKQIEFLQLANSQAVPITKDYEAFWKWFKEESDKLLNKESNSGPT